MKIRSGFVSNSSSSSFCILGVSASNKDYKKVSDIPYNERNENTLTYESGINDSEEKYIGFNPERMRDDETLGQFKDRIIAAAEKIGIVIEKKNLDWITDGGYNG